MGRIELPPMPAGKMEARLVYVDDIEVPPDHRPLVEEKVKVIMGSFTRVGQLAPITITTPVISNGFLLISGGHRLEAARRLGWDRIWTIERSHSDNPHDLRLVEIAEKLHRAELTALEHDELTAEWIRLTAEKEPKLAQVAPVSKGGRGKEGGINAAVRELGIERTDAQRAVKVDSLSPEAKETARETGLDDNRSALLSAAKETEPAAQVAALQEHKEKVASAKTTKPRPRTRPARSPALRRASRNWKRRGNSATRRIRRNICLM